ncbi:MAG: HmuY family protein [Alphaproteobacteria bacterium]|nr:HmuY family protein [Alphaproteobacteria bacterium]
MRWLPSLLAGCLLPDLSGSLDPGPPAQTTPPVVVVTTGTGDTAEPLVVAELTVDATDHDLWVGLDLDTLDPAAPADDPSVDLRLRRFEVLTNGGASGDGGVLVARLDGVAFADVHAVPTGLDWRADEPDADEDGHVEGVFDDWYVYDETTHELTPAPVTWLVRTTEDAVFRLVFLSYYDPSGTPARVSLRVGTLHPDPDED